MTTRLYEYLCVCGNKLHTQVTLRNYKSGERCEACHRVFDVNYKGIVTLMPLPEKSKVTLNNGCIHPQQYPIVVDSDPTTLEAHVIATLIKEIP